MLRVGLSTPVGGQELTGDTRGQLVMGGGFAWEQRRGQIQVCFGGGVGRTC